MTVTCSSLDHAVVKLSEVDVLGCVSSVLSS